MMLHRSSAAREIAKRNEEGMRTVSKLFNDSVYNPSAILLRKPEVFDYETQKTAQNKTLASLRKAIEKLPPEKIASIISLSSDVSTFLNKSIYGQSKQDLRLMLDILPHGVISPRKPYDEAAKFMGDYDRLTINFFDLSPINKARLFGTLMQGKMPPKEDIEALYGEGATALRDGDYFNLQYAGTKRKIHIPSTYSDSVRKSSNLLSKMVFYLARGYNPAYMNSHAEESVNAAISRGKTVLKQKLKRTLARLDDQTRFLHSLGGVTNFDSKAISPQANRLVILSRSNAADLKSLLGYIDRIKTPNSLPPSPLVHSELTMLHGFKSGNPAASREFLETIGSWSPKDQVAFLLRLDPHSQNLLGSHMRQNPQLYGNLPEMLSVSRQLLKLLSSSFKEQVGLPSRAVKRLPKPNTKKLE